MELSEETLELLALLGDMAAIEALMRFVDGYADYATTRRGKIYTHIIR